MSKTKTKGVPIYGIVGLGRFGMALAIELSKTNTDIIVVDSDEAKISQIREYIENAFIVHDLSKQTLLQAGFANCDIAIVCVGEQIDVSVMTTLTLIEMGIPSVISKATSYDHGKILAKLGAEVVYPERDMALRLANRLQTGILLDFVQLSEKINISKLLVPQMAIGKSVLDIDARGKFGLNIIAIERNGEVIDKIVPEFVFVRGDILYLAGDREGLLKFSKWNN